ncbi:sugar transferase [Candidatus Saccharibacteria bacterium]|nr:sugar transferase [Candidatus Saccharibacteria bacterium]
MKKRSELFFSFILVPIDYLMLVVGFVLAFFWREAQNKPFAYLVSGHSYLNNMLWLIPIWILIFAIVGLYALTSVRSRWHELGRIIAATLAGTMILIIIDFFWPNPVFPSKSIPVYAFIFGTLLVLAGRVIIRLIQRFLFRYGVGVYKVAILGGGSTARQLSQYLTRSDRGYKIINNDIDPKSNLNGHLEDLYAKGLDEIIVVDPQIPDKNLVDIINYCENNHIIYKFVPSIAGLYTSRLQSIQYRDLTLLEVVPTPLEGWGRIVKRLFDLLFSLLAVIVLSPIMLVLVIIMKLTDSGPIIYKHQRLTRAGKPLWVYKFRSMKQAYCTGGQFDGKTDLEVLASFNNPRLIEEWKKDQKLRNDPRVSKIGKFMRKTSLDELPQLFNIIKGELSMVGPRPIVEDELKRYGKVSNLFLKIKPGLTGLWQVSGRSDIDYEERVKLDIYYIENWSLWLDLIILIKTVSVVLRGRGGY